MALDSAFCEAFVHGGSHRCCGLQLSRFTLRHALGLQVLNFAEGELDEALFLRVVFLCSARDEAEWQHALTVGPSRWRLWWMRERYRLAMARQQARFGAYLDDYLTVPKPMDGPGAKGLSTPGVFARVAQLMSTLGMSREEAWAMSPGEAVVMCHAAGELKGSKLRWETEAEKEIWRKLGHDI